MNGSQTPAPPAPCRNSSGAPLPPRITLTEQPATVWDLNELDAKAEPHLLLLYARMVRSERPTGQPRRCDCGHAGTAAGTRETAHLNSSSGRNNDSLGM